MRTPRNGFLVAAILVAVAGAAAIAAAGPSRTRLAYERRLDATPFLATAKSEQTTAKLADTAAPPELQGDGWPTANADLANTRVARGSSIGAGNVERLGIAWRVRLDEASKWGSAASGPLISNGVVFFQDLASNVVALELLTGRIRWRHVLRQKAFGPNGPALGWGRVYAQDGDHHLLALDATTGTRMWQTGLNGPTGQQQPVAFGGAVYTGIASGRKRAGPGELQKTALLGPNSSGWAYGIRARDGRIAWSFRTVTEGNWGNPVNGGAGIWFPPAIDSQTGITYWSTGNPGPAPGTSKYPNASSRPGPNLYSNTLLAIDGRTGRVNWWHQLLPHDIYHHDLQNAPILVRAGGRDLIVASGKMGFVFALDRSTGRLVWRRAVGRHENDNLKRLPPGRVVQVYPGFWGGIETPGAFADGTLYFQVDDLPTPYTATAWDAKDGQTSVENLEGRTVYAKGTSSLIALDAGSGRILWQHRFGTVGFGAATVVNDLVFTSTYDGMVYALRRRDGREVWRWQAPGGINAWPAVSGDTIILPVGLGLRPQLIALRLGAKEHATIGRARPEHSPR